MTFLFTESSIPQMTALSYNKEDLSLLCDWESKWQLEFDKFKCYVLHMSLKKHNL